MKYEWLYITSWITSKAVSLSLPSYIISTRRIAQESFISNRFISYWIKPIFIVQSNKINTPKYYWQKSTQKTVLVHFPLMQYLCEVCLECLRLSQQWPLFLLVVAWQVHGWRWRGGRAAEDHMKTTRLYRYKAFDLVSKLQSSKNKSDFLLTFNSSI